MACKIRSSPGVFNVINLYTPVRINKAQDVLMIQLNNVKDYLMKRTNNCLKYVYELAELCVIKILFFMKHVLSFILVLSKKILQEFGTQTHCRSTNLNLAPKKDGRHTTHARFKFRKQPREF